MCLTASSEFLQLENWLAILITTYKDHPSRGLAKIINYYLERLVSHDDLNYSRKKRCDYLVMKKFWRWQATH